MQLAKDQIEKFAKDVEIGLSAEPKYIPSKYFYDKRGDDIFIKIMQMPEYYLTRAEFEIFRKQGEDIIKTMGLNGKHFNLYELGAGDGTKTIELIKILKAHPFRYRPVDISENSIQMLQERIDNELPWVKTNGIQGDYFEVMQRLNGYEPKVILFLGKNEQNIVPVVEHL